MGNSSGSLNASFTNNKILQVVESEFTGTWSQVVSAASTYYTVTGFGVTITPKSLNSKILLMYNVSWGFSTGGGGAIIMAQAIKDGSPIGTSQGNHDTNYVPNSTASRKYAVATASASHGGLGFVIIDQPTSLSSTTYGLRLANWVGTTGTLYVNAAGSDTNDSSHSRSYSNIVAMEIL